MDSLPISLVMMLFEDLPHGPAQDFVRSRAQSHHEFGDHAIEAALRRAMSEGVDDLQHGPVVRAAVERLLARTEPSVPPPPVNQMCGHCGTLMKTLYYYKMACATVARSAATRLAIGASAGLEVTVDAPSLPSSASS